MAARVATSRVLLLTSARPGTEGGAAVRPDETLTLRPLSPEQVGDVVASAAALPEGLRASGTIEALHAASGGTPMLLLSAIQLALDRGWLARAGDEWTAPDLSAFLQELRGGRPLQHRVAALGPQERRVLLMLAVSGHPLGADTIVADGGPAPPVLLALESAGLIVRNDGSWECGHDLLAEQIVALASEEEVVAAHARLGQLEDGDPRRRARHLLRAGRDAELVRLVIAHVRQARRSGDRRAVRLIARELLGPGASDTVLRTIARAVPLRLRVPSYVLAGAGLAAAIVVMLSAYGWLSQPARLVVRDAPRPSENGTLFSTVEVLDRLGRLVRRSRDTVVATSPQGVEDRTPVVRGIATFDSMTSIQATTVGFARIRFSMSGVPVVVLDSVAVGWESSRIWIAGGTLNGQLLRPDEPTVRVAPGVLIDGDVTVGFSMRAWEAAVLCAAVPMWGSRERSAIPFTSLPPSATRDRRPAPLSLRAPERPGRYRLVFAAGTETEARFIASGTNWDVGRAIWNDGNDIRDWGEREFRGVDRNGGIYVDWVRSSPPLRVRYWVPAAVIEIEVTR